MSKQHDLKSAGMMLIFGGVLIEVIFKHMTSSYSVTGFLFIGYGMALLNRYFSDKD